MRHSLYQRNKCNAAVGVQFNESILSRLPGVERNSLGIHHDTGLLHSDSSEGTPFFQYGPGDTLTVAINFVTDSILLFKNGLSRGAALVGLPGGGLMYPAVGFDHAEACISINFGHTPFRCDASNPMRYFGVWRGPVACKFVIRAAGRKRHCALTMLFEFYCKACLNK